MCCDKHSYVQAIHLLLVQYEKKGLYLIPVSVSKRLVVSVRLDLPFMFRTAQFHEIL